MGRLERTLREVEHVERQSGEAQAITELFDEDTGADEYQIFGHGIAHIDVDDIGQGDGTHHWPQPALETVATSQHATKDATQRQANNANGTTGQSELLR